MKLKTPKTIRHGQRPKESEVDSVIWFSNMQANYGLVCYTNKMGKRKIYLSAVSGLNAQDDINHILNYGCKVTPDQIKQLYNFITNGQED